MEQQPPGTNKSESQVANDNSDSDKRSNDKNFTDANSTTKVCAMILCMLYVCLGRCPFFIARFFAPTLTAAIIEQKDEALHPRTSFRHHRRLFEAKAFIVTINTCTHL